MTSRLFSVVFFLFLAVIGTISVELFNALTCDEDEDYCIAWPEALLPNGVNGDGKPMQAQSDCSDRVDQCSYFAGNGECTLNPGTGYMLISIYCTIDLCNE